MDVLQLNHETVLSLLPDRDPCSHKGDFGRVLLLCGSRGYTGAAALSAMGALRTGAGLVYLGVPESIYAIEAVKLTEAIIFPVAEESGAYSVNAVEAIKPLLPKMDAVLIGPGIGISRGACAMVKYVLENFLGPVVLDADGINFLALHKDILRGRTSPTVLTPHAGEFLRLCPQMSNNRQRDAIDFARQYGVVVLLKGHPTIITDGRTVYENLTGNPGMATGGSGDILAGMVVSLIGQGLPVFEATACCAWLHGAAGDMCAEQLGQYGMIPSDMLNVLPQLMK